MTESSTLIGPTAPYLEAESYMEIRVELATRLDLLQAVTKAGIRFEETVEVCYQAAFGAPRCDLIILDPHIDSNKVPTDRRTDLFRHSYSELNV